MEQGRSTSLRLSNQPQKLIPRDISESLGKLPPQALDLEEAVLGALMLETNAITTVKFLKPHHFYDDRHAEIFRAIFQLHTDGVNPDMRAVVNQLRGIGKIELIGGPYYIAELTSKVSSAANIEYHSRVIVEQAMKRAIISIASQIHHDAYEDTTDIFDLIKKTQEDITFLEERETASSGPERIKALWEQTLIVSKPEEQPPLIYLSDTPVCTPGNHTLLIGKKKSRKSLLVTYLLHQFLQPKTHVGDNIAVFDTEQGKLHVWKGRDRLYRMTNQNVPFFWLRGKSPAERREFITMTVANWSARTKHPLKILVIDGIRDLMSNINDPDESTEVIVWLEKLTLEYNLSIINILHINKTDNNARGHIGSELLNKAECTIQVDLDEKSGFSVVKCESSREKPFEPFMFTHGPTGLPEMIGVPTGDGAANQDDQVKKLQLIFEDEMLKRKELEEGVKSHFAIGQNKAKQLIAQWIARGWIIKNGKDRDPKTTFKLMAQPGFIPVPPKPAAELFDSNSVNPVDEPPDDLPF